jgi:cysteine synthase
MRANSILDTIGRTPHVHLQRLFGSRVEVWMKLERANPGGSIKDRIALAMIEDAEHRGALGQRQHDRGAHVGETRASAWPWWRP